MKAAQGGSELVSSSDWSILLGFYFPGEAHLMSQQCRSLWKMPLWRLWVTAGAGTPQEQGVLALQRSMLMGIQCSHLRQRLEPVLKEPGWSCFPSGWERSLGQDLLRVFRWLFAQEGVQLWLWQICHPAAPGAVGQSPSPAAPPARAQQCRGGRGRGDCRAPPI